MFGCSPYSPTFFIHVIFFPLNFVNFLLDFREFFFFFFFFKKKSKKKDNSDYFSLRPVQLSGGVGWVLRMGLWLIRGLGLSLSKRMKNLNNLFEPKKSLDVKKRKKEKQITL